MKSIKGHNGYWSCEQCEIQGLYESSHIVFHTTDCTPRVNDIFNNYGYVGKHHVQRSCLIDYGMNCINGFPLDYMHLVCLGVVKRLTLFWKEGPRGPHRLPAVQLSQTSNKMEEMTGPFPSKFVRQQHGFDEVKRWKATELEQFLLYSGCVALKDILTHEYYKHFLMLSLAMRILLDENEKICSHYLTNARDLLHCFVGKCQELYGNAFIVYNVHGLLHLWEDSHFKKLLDEISSFSFENYSQVLKKFVRKSQNPLSQVLKRVAELEEHALSGSYHKVICRKYSVNKKDVWLLLTSGDFVLIEEIINEDLLLCHVYKKHNFQNLFTVPCELKLFNIVYVPSCLNAQGTLEEMSKRLFLRKAISVPYKNGHVLISILHDITK